ncbi:MAG: L,D-transpeptidase [Zetaproteobacteria bacterium CG2_30_46_52]|nr:MAG: L,D-transpeptidase [Zetaproteobacteria bacterium CG2_30_46_52]
MIKIIVSEQLLIHHRASGEQVSYPISTAALGVGNALGSYQTPLGKHRLFACIGGGYPKGTIFVGREPVGLFEPSLVDEDKDWILTRILWLEGLEEGYNKGGDVDTKARYIYIHGTNEEGKIGTPASHGCIRMRNDDVLDLFEHVAEGEVVDIT